MSNFRSDPLGLVETPAPVLSGVGSVDEKVDLAGAGSSFDPVETVDKVACACLHAEAIEHVLTESLLGQFAKIDRYTQVVRLEGALERALQLAFSIGLIELGTADTNPGAAARSTGANVWGNFPVRREREPNQFLSRRGSPRENASALRNVRF